MMDAATGRVRRTVEGDLIRLTVSPDGHWLYGSTSDGSFVEPVDGGKRVPLAEPVRDGVVVARRRGGRPEGHGGHDGAVHHRRQVRREGRRRGR
nr:hypothetical protein [Nocardioides convexus]